MRDADGASPYDWPDEFHAYLASRETEVDPFFDPGLFNPEPSDDEDEEDDDDADAV